MRLSPASMLVFLISFSVALGAQGDICNTACETCVATEDANACCGIKDSHCARCAEGYRWWPCGNDYIDKCLCVGREPSSPEAEEAVDEMTETTATPSSLFGESSSSGDLVVEESEAAQVADPSFSSSTTEENDEGGEEESLTLSESIAMQAQEQQLQEPATPTSTSTLGGVCSVSCETCVAAEDANFCCGIDDDACAKCSNGYEYWPCGSDFIDKCICVGESSNDVIDALPVPPQELPAASGSTAQADTTSYQVGNVGSCGIEISQELLDGPHPPAACKTCACGACYRVTLNGRSQKVQVVDQTGTTTFEIAGKGPPGPTTGSDAWGDLCPRCSNLNTCVDDGPFNGAYCSKQPVTYERVPC